MISEILDQTQTIAEEIRNNELQYTSEAMAAGDAVRQGDVYFVHLDVVPSDVVGIPYMTQLAPGTTQGSRHCIESPDGVTMYRRRGDHPLVGPCLECSQPVTITHPEHGDWRLHAGVWQVRYQRQFAEELRRVED